MVNYNGQIFPKDAPLFTAQNRSYRYGDGLFETLRLFAGKAPFLALHLQRLKQGMEALQMEIPKAYTAAFFLQEILKINTSQRNARIRLSVFRQGGGKYSPESNEAAFLIESTPLEHDHFALNPKGLHIDLFPEKLLHFNRLSPWKTANGLPYILARRFVQAQQLDDCLMLNNLGQIAEASSSNLFVYTNRILRTPPIESGALQGTMRQVVLEIASALGIPILEVALQEMDIEAAEEVWLTNAIQGIRWVAKFKTRQFVPHLANRFVGYLNKKIQSEN